VTHLPVITNSELKSYRRCPREHRYAYGLGYRPIRSGEASYLGTVIHEGLAMWWASGRGARGLDAALGVADALADPYQRILAKTLLAGYHTRWSSEPTETLAVEAEFRSPLVNPATGFESLTYQLGGKIDALCRYQGQTLLVEHKTTSEDITPGSDYWRRLRLDSQISMYYHGSRALGFEPEGCLYDVIRKPALRPYEPSSRRPLPETPEAYGERLLEAIAKEPERYYQRAVVVRLEADEREAAADTWHLARMMREGELARRSPRNPDSCVRWGATCPYFGVCTGVASLEDETKFRKTTRKHEELTDGQSSVLSPRLFRGDHSARNAGQRRYPLVRHDCLPGLRFGRRSS
jgi:hypothetical protein